MVMVIVPTNSAPRHTSTMTVSVGSLAVRQGLEGGATGGLASLDGDRRGAMEEG